MQSRYLIGIDLGTTNCSVSYIDTANRRSVQQLALPQLTSKGFVRHLFTLPSFCYLSVPGEWSPKDLSLPWKEKNSYFVGELAREQGLLTPTRVVASAKSWLSSTSIDRKERLLPPAADESLRISPLEATKRYLIHIKNSWNHIVANGFDEQIEGQEIILTIPASFDEVARKLTAQAAQEVGLSHVTLLEEPQAAFYDWIRLHEKQWQQQMKKNDTIAICDVGGGTTDFSLLEVVEKNGCLGFQRTSVGDHLLLGGDNMDIFLAHHILQHYFDSQELTRTQWLKLCHEARRAKEAEKSYSIHLASEGSKVVSKALFATLQGEEMRAILCDAFFGIYPKEQALDLKKRSGVRSLGLPYETESSITKHFAHFLEQNKMERAPDFVLFNGGAFKPKAFQEAMIGSITTWFTGSSPHILTTNSLELSVSRGAAYYAQARRGAGIQISGGSARAYYIELAVNDQSLRRALTLLPRGSEEGAYHESSEVFMLSPNQPVSFQLYTSHTRLNDSAGSIVEIVAEEMQPLPTLHTVIHFGKAAATEPVAVRIKASLTPLGTVNLWLDSQTTEHRWALEFQMREQKIIQDKTSDQACNEQIKEFIRSFFTHKVATKPIEYLENLIGSSRSQWSISTLRTITDSLLLCSAKNEQRVWWNLLGYSLRPGCGYPLDEHRVQKVWRALLLDEPTDVELKIQRAILLRRISGGLSKGQQMQLASTLHLARPKVFKGQDLYYYCERIRALASFERIEHKLKIRIAETFLSYICSGEAVETEYWALGRIASRDLLFAFSSHMLSAEIVESWALKLLSSEKAELKWLVFPLAKMAYRGGDIEFYLSKGVVERISQKFINTDFWPRFQKYSNPLAEQKEQSYLFGESLPAGLLLERL